MSKGDDLDFDDESKALNIEDSSRPAIDKEWKNPFWHKAPFILGNELCERLAYYGMSTNLSTYLTKQLGYGVGPAASQMQIWQGTAYLTPLLGAYLADAVMGRFKVIAVFSTIYIIGLSLLTCSAVIPGIKPPGDGTPANGLQLAAFWISMYTIALGTGGIKPNVASFGADQFDPTHPKEAAMIPSFFNYFYLSINIGSLVASTFVVWVQENVGWGVGFLIPTLAMFAAIIAFFVASSRYIKKPAAGNPYKELIKIVAAAMKRRKVPAPLDSSEFHEEPESHYRASGRHMMPHSSDLKWLDKAAAKDASGYAPCSLTDVEEVKCIIRLLPIALISIAYQTVYTQMFSVYVMQGSGMAGSIPAASMSTLDIVAILVGMPIYDRIIAPILTKKTKWTILKRIGWGYVLAALSIGIAAFVELKRLSVVKANGLEEIDPSVTQPPISIWWQSPQYIIIGLSEVLAMSGLYEFYYSQAPDSLVSFCMAIQLLTIALGSYLSSAIVMVMGIITCCPGWLPPDGYTVNQGHIDYFFWLLTIFQILGIALHIPIAMRFRPKQILEYTESDDPDMGEDLADRMMSKTMVSMVPGSEVSRRKLTATSKKWTALKDEEQVY